MSNQLSIKDVAVALYKGNITEKFGRSVEDGNDLLRKAIMEVAGCKDGWDYYTFQHNKNLVFKLLSEVLEETVGEAIINKYNDWVDFRSVALGDTIEFRVPNTDLFEVGIVADGTDNLRRQRIMHGKIAMQSFQLGVKIYEEFLMFRLGRINWVDLVNRVAKSVDNALMQIIVKQIENAYGTQELGDNYTFKGTYADEELVRVIQNVEAKTGQRVAIYGSASALAKVRMESSALFSERDKEDLRNNGHVGMFNGRECIELPNFMDKNDNLVLSNAHLFIVPAGTKIIKLLNEGNAEVYEVTDQHNRADNQIEYQFVSRYQLGVLKSNVYGVIEIAE